MTAPINGERISGWVTEPGPQRPWYVYIGIGVVTLMALAMVVVVPWRQLGPATAQLTYEPVVDGTTMTIDGTTDLPDGTTLQWALWQPSATDLDAEISGLMEEGMVTVRDGRFNATFESGPYAPGTTLRFVVRFWPQDDQPPETVERFGPTGDKLRGPGVRETTDGVYFGVDREVVIR